MAKILGYILLAAGILVVFVSLFYAYGIFSGKSMPAQIFLKPISQQNIQAAPSDIQGQVQTALSKFLPVNYVVDILNILAMSLLMWIFIYGGGKIAEIGIKLLK